MIVADGRCCEKLDKVIESDEEDAILLVLTIDLFTGVDGPLG